MVSLLFVIAVVCIVWYAVKSKRKQNNSDSIPQPSPTPPQQPIQESATSESLNDKKTDELITDYTLLFNTSLSKWCFKKDMIYLTGVGIQYHYYDFKSYIHEFICGTIEREPNNPKDKNAIRFADIEGKTIGYIPKNDLKNVYDSFGDDFEPRPFFGKIVHHPEGKNKSILYSITYGNNLNDEKKGMMKTVAEHINSFINSEFDYFYR